MLRMTFKDGNLSSDSHVKVAGEYTCRKGTTSKFMMDWPEGLVMTSIVTVSNLSCPCCGETAMLPQGKYYVKDGVLVGEY